MMNQSNTSQLATYADSIREAHHHLLGNYQDVFVIGQGLWSPWYVGNTMDDLEKIYGKRRIIDTPVSESAITGIAVGAAISGMKPIVLHPRMDFMLYAMDPIVNQAAKWSTMFAGQSRAPVTIRSIVNRGGEQGAQHSQALHAWFAHIPGLRVVMPATAKDARDMLVSSVLSDDPVVYIDDRWLYKESEIHSEIEERSINEYMPNIVSEGSHITIAAAGYSTSISLAASKVLRERGIYAEVIDLRVIAPLNPDIVVSSVCKTGRLLVVDGGWHSCGFSSEIIASVIESSVTLETLRSVQRICLPFAPAPTASNLERAYYPNCDVIVERVCAMMR